MPEHLVDQPFDPALLAVLVCPVTKQPLLYVSASGERPARLISPAGRLRFPIDGGVPVLLASEAISLSEAELQAEIDAAREMSADRGMTDS